MFPSSASLFHSLIAALSGDDGEWELALLLVLGVGLSPQTPLVCMYSWRKVLGMTLLGVVGGG